MGTSSLHQAGCAIPIRGTNSVPADIVDVADHRAPSGVAEAGRDTDAVATVVVPVTALGREGCVEDADHRRITPVDTITAAVAAVDTAATAPPRPPATATASTSPGPSSP